MFTYLIHARRDFSLFEQLLKHGDGAVGNTNVTHKTILDELFHFTPCVDKRNIEDLEITILILYLKLIMLITMEFPSHGPMQHVHINVFELEILERTFKGRTHMLGLTESTPQLGSDENFFTRDIALTNSFAKRFFGLVYQGWFSWLRSYRIEMKVTYKDKQCQNGGSHNQEQP